jgi:phage terminase small subunit
MAELTDKHRRFADEYLIDMDAIRAYIKVYNCKESTAKVNAYRLLDNASISAYVKEKQDEVSEKLNLTHEWVLEKLKTCVDKSMQEVEVEKWDYEEKQMVGTGEYIYDSKGATKALELIGKHLGMFKDKLELSGETGVRIINDIPRDSKCKP